MVPTILVSRGPSSVRWEIQPVPRGEVVSGPHLAHESKILQGKPYEIRAIAEWGGHHCKKCQYTAPTYRHAWPNEPWSCEHPLAPQHSYNRLILRSRGFAHGFFFCRRCGWHGMRLTGEYHGLTRRGCDPPDRQDCTSIHAPGNDSQPARWRGSHE